MVKSLFIKMFGLFLTCAALLFAPDAAKAQDTVSGGITLDMKDVTLETVMNAIERQSGYLFLNNQVDVSRTVSISVTDASIENVLDKLFKGTGINWRIQGTNIYISNKPVQDTGDGKTGNAISGTIVDETGYPVIGAGVLIQGTTTGASTDLDGKFSFVLPEGMEDRNLEITCLGYASQVFPIGSRRVFDVTLQTDAIMMEGTVVTALGIRRAEKALSYNVQEIDSEELLANKDANFVNSLNGKVAGLVINASSSGVGGASKVVMRGQKSIEQSSNALYVIDGVPMYTMAKEGGTEFSSQGTTDPVADINPEDIESMTVLTGAAAAALYGSDAANGAIVITTKQGQAGKTSITISSNTEVSMPFVLPRFQNTYGTGNLQNSAGSDYYSWGQKMNDSNRMSYDPGRDYYQMGVTGTESVSFSTGTDKNQLYLSAAAVNSRGIVPNNKYDRYNFTFRNTTSFLNDKMKFDIGASYILQDDRNMTNQGTYSNPIVGAYLFPRGNDWEAVRMFERWDMSRNLYTQYWPVGAAGLNMQNPYWINYRNLRENKKDRYMLNAGLSYQILDWLNISGRIRIDNSANKYTEKYYASTDNTITDLSNRGLYSVQETSDKQIYGDVLLNVNKTWTDWSLQATAGASFTDMRSDLLQVRGPISDGSIAGEKAGLANVFNVMNLSQSRTSRLQSGWREQTQSVFASAEVGFKGIYYLTLTGRSDWPSQLAGPNSSQKAFFYPSIGASIVVSDLIGNMPEELEYLKVRGSYASVGVAFERFIANPQYSWNSNNSSWNTQTQYPLYNLKPERTSSWEVGLTMRFLKYFSLDATYYHALTSNQTFDPKISVGSGWSNMYVQSGSVLNNGVELALGFDNTWGIFNWNSNFTFSTNHNKILSLADDIVVEGVHLNIDQLDMNGLDQAHFILREGGTLGDLYSLVDLKRDSNGMIYVDENGSVTKENISDPDKYIKLGSVLPKANLAWNNNFRIGNFSLGFLFTARLGGVVYSKTQAMIDGFGVSEASAIARDNGGVAIGNGDFVDAQSWYQQVGNSSPVPQYYTYSATNVRLQEASIGYTFPRKMLKGVCELTLQLVGRNLWMIYNKAPFDPESIATTSNYYQGIDYFMLPSTRNFGFNVRLKF